MPTFSLDRLPEVFLSNKNLSLFVSQELKRGKIRRLASKLYTKNLIEKPEIIVRRNLWPIVAAYYPGALIADRTAIENAPAKDGSVFIVSSKKRAVKLPGITIFPRKGENPLPSDKPLSENCISPRCHAPFWKTCVHRGQEKEVLRARYPKKKLRNVWMPY